MLAAARGAALELNPRLRELDIGDWEGLTRDEIASASGEVLRRFDARDPDVRPGGGETLRELDQRAVSIAANLVGAYRGRRLAVVTHLGVLRALLGEFRAFARSDAADPVALGPPLQFEHAGWRHLDRAQLLAAASMDDAESRVSSGNF